MLVRVSRAEWVCRRGEFRLSARHGYRARMPDDRPRDHPRFAAAWTVLAGAAERASLGRLRTKALAPARGRLLILGSGQGHDVAHIPDAVTSVIAVEPDESMRRRAGARLRAARVPVTSVGAAGEALPFPDGSVDTVLCALVLCSVDDPSGVVAELRRVLTDDGVLLIMEHVLASPGSKTARAQRKLDRGWAAMAGGCHLTRTTVQVLCDGGFDTAGLRELGAPKVFPLLPLVAGAASIRPQPAGRAARA